MKANVEGVELSETTVKEEDSLAFDAEELKSLSEAAYEKIKQAIIAGGLAPGSRLSERNLSEQMRVSTTTVKRALGRLSAEGLVEILPRRGTYVSDSFSRSMEENTIVRAYLEGLAARFAAQKADEKDLENLRSQIEVMRRCTEAGSVGKIVEANGRFHRLVHEAAKNQYVRRMIAVIKSFDVKFRNESHRLDPEESKRGFRDHLSVFKAIEARNGDLAEERMKNHILRTLKFVLEEEAK